MTNSDNAFGTFNKITHIASQVSDGSTALTAFGSVDAAKDYFFTTAAQTIFDETCTQLQWALLNDDDDRATKLKWTMSFGTKGTGTGASDDWAAVHITRKQALIDAPTKSHAVSNAVLEGYDARDPEGTGTLIITVTANGHDFEVGDRVTFTGVGGMTQLNDEAFIVETVSSNQFTFYGKDSMYPPNLGTYTSGGTAIIDGENQWSANPSSIVTDNGHLF